ncbi:YlbL family protein [Microbacterium sp. CJ88]|uniref:YlbL family protein n=1 Tax=Microbacterium sp. CJ88 TaxID=3445672 RepID=UPI003F65DE45
MALFDEDVTITPAPRRRASRRVQIGSWSLTVALVVMLVITFLPTAYVIQQPGPVYDTLGTTQKADGSTVPLISIGGAQTYPTDGSLDLLTVQVVGNPDRTPSWLELASAWFDPSRAVLPMEAVFPAGQTTEQRNQQSATDMVDSQKEATAAALTELGYAVPSHLTVYSIVDGSAATGILQKGDIVRAADGTPVTDAAGLRAIVNGKQGAPVDVTIERAGQEQTVSITPQESTAADGTKTWLVGVTLLTDFSFPIDVTIQLNDVGGPSAGMMFALGIIDTLTPGSLTGGQKVAGTGTITADGTVGPIGGIRQKLYGAAGAGASWFLAPAANCNEVVGHVPSGLRVFSVQKLGDALTALQTIRDGGDLNALPTCS